MLILARRPQQAIKIGDDITITLLEIHPTHIKVGIDAPRDVPVDREEIWLQKRAQRGSGANKRER